jgi:hypothetical protein
LRHIWSEIKRGKEIIAREKSGEIVTKRQIIPFVFRGPRHQDKISSIRMMQLPHVEAD